MMSIVVYDGSWLNESSTGIMRRNVWDTSSAVSIGVAPSTVKNSHSYTDFHNVDEDSKTIASYGGESSLRLGSGVMEHNLCNTSTSVAAVSTGISNNAGYVASMCRHLEMFVYYYTDAHDVDEEMRAVGEVGGFAANGGGVGIVNRTMNDTSSYYSVTVASSNIQKYEIIRIITMSTNI